MKTFFAESEKWIPAAIPKAPSSIHPTILGMPAVSQIVAIFKALWMPPHFINLMLTISTAPSSIALSASDGEWIDSSAIIGMFVFFLTKARPSMSLAGVGCSTNSISNLLNFSIAETARLGLHP
jgi:hypothetical protein